MRYHLSRSRRSYWWSQSLTTIESALRSRSERYALPILLLKMFAHLGYFSLKSLGGTWMQRIRNRTAPLDGHACLSAKTHCSMALAEGPWGRWWKGQLKKIHTSCWSSHLQSFHLFTFKFYQAEHSPNSWWAVDKNNAKTGQAHLQLATHRRLYLFPFNHLRILPSSSSFSSSSANFINTTTLVWHWWLDQHSTAHSIGFASDILYRVWRLSFVFSNTSFTTLYIVCQELFALALASPPHSLPAFLLPLFGRLPSDQCLMDYIWLQADECCSLLHHTENAQTLATVDQSLLLGERSFVISFLMWFTFLIFLPQTFLAQLISLFAFPLLSLLWLVKSRNLMTVSCTLRWPI